MTNVPIRTRLTVLRDGSTNEAPVAFCAAEARSVPLSRCAACGFATRFARDEQGRFAALTCHRIVRSGSSADESGDRAAIDAANAAASASRTTPVGLALTRPFLCFAEDAPLRVVSRYFDRESAAFGFPVVDDRSRLVGTLARATAVLALVSAARADRQVGAMVFPSRVVSERATVTTTLASMRERGPQELLVLDDDRTLVGVLRDIDALLIEARSGSDPGIQLAG